MVWIIILTIKTCLKCNHVFSISLIHASIKLLRLTNQDQARARQQEWSCQIWCLIFFLLLLLLFLGVIHGVSFPSLSMACTQVVCFILDHWTCVRISYNIQQYLLLYLKEEDGIAHGLKVEIRLKGKKWHKNF